MEKIMGHNSLIKFRNFCTEQFQTNFVQFPFFYAVAFPVIETEQIAIFCFFVNFLSSYPGYLRSDLWSSYSEGGLNYLSAPRHNRNKNFTQKIQAKTKLQSLQQRQNKFLPIQTMPVLFKPLRGPKRRIRNVQKQRPRKGSLKTRPTAKKIHHCTVVERENIN